MSFSLKKEIKCKCGELFEADLWSSVNTGEDACLKEAILSGELNVVGCPVCGSYFYAEFFLLYHDPGKELLAYVYPGSCAAYKGMYEKKMHDEFNEARKGFAEEEQLKYLPVALFGMDELVGLLKREEDEEFEGWVLAGIVKPHNIRTLRIRPYIARKYCLPPLLPVAGANELALKDGIMEGLREALKLNDTLRTYKDLKQRLEDDTLSFPDDMKEHILSSKNAKKQKKARAKR